MDCYDLLSEVCDRYDVHPEARCEIRKIFALVKEEYEIKGYSEGWTTGFKSCERD